jgi:transcriptional regulator with XRE-family HTH domain
VRVSYLPEEADVVSIGKTKRMRLERIAQGKSVSALSYDARVPAPVLGWIEAGRFTPYAPQLERIAKALGFKGDPHELLEDVPDQAAVGC